MKSARWKIQFLRKEYISEGIRMKDLADNPIQQFERWMQDAVNKKIDLPDAMHLATVGADGRPSGRIVLLKGFDERGFVFFTNYESRKGSELKINNNASMTFFWNKLFRQVRIEGHVYQLPAEESDSYFKSRPREAQIAAHASEQSKMLENRDRLDEKVKELDNRFKNQSVPRPANWGGFYLSPVSVEFWQGRVHRLHDRVLYKKDENCNSWTITLLNP